MSSPSIIMFVVVSAWTMLGSVLFVAFGDESNPFFTGVTCLGWLAVTILLWVRLCASKDTYADQFYP